MFNVLAGLVAFFYSLIPSYGIAISLLTLAVMLVLAPFTIKGTRSMLAMQALQPEIKRLQAKHKGDRQALNEAMMGFYKEHSVNPLAGCLPLVVQMPVLLVMYRVIRGLTYNRPHYIKHTTKLYQALIQHGHLADPKHGGPKTVKMPFLGMDLAKAARGLHGSFGSLLPLYVLIALVIVTGFVQARQMSGKTPQAAQANPQAQMMQKVFPLITGVISIEIPAGVVLYFLISNVFRIVQTDLMYRFDPALSAAVKKEVAEVEAKAEEIKKKPTNPPGSSNGARRRSAKRRRGR